MALRLEDTAPTVSRTDENGKTVSSCDLGGSRDVVYFYPKDDTPGSTTEACQFNDAVPTARGERLGRGEGVIGRPSSSTPRVASSEPGTS